MTYIALTVGAIVAITVVASFAVAILATLLKDDD